MLDVVYRFGTGPADREGRPVDGEAARQLLEAGNAAFAGLFEPGRDGTTPPVVEVAAGDIGLEPGPSGILAHEPFAAVVGCADARVPVELLFGRAVNDLFVLRVAGNVLGSEVIGSLDYAITNLPSVRLAVVLGHTRCGAVTAAVGAYLDPAGYLGLAAEHQLRGIVDQLFPAIRLAHAAMLRTWRAEAAQEPGFVPALVEVAAVLNAAIMASSLRSELSAYGAEQVLPVFGVYDLASHRVGVPLGDHAPPTTVSRLLAPPADAEGFTALADELATSPLVHALLGD